MPKSIHMVRALYEIGSHSELNRLKHIFMIFDPCTWDWCASRHIKYVRNKITNGFKWIIDLQSPEPRLANDVYPWLRDLLNHSQIVSWCLFPVVPHSFQWIWYGKCATIAVSLTCDVEYHNYIPRQTLCAFQRVNRYWNMHLARKITYGFK